MRRLSKPFECAVRARVPHGVTPELVVTLRPDGTLSLRELRRRRGEQNFCLGSLYVRALVTQNSRR